MAQSIIHKDAILDSIEDGIQKATGWGLKKDLLSREALC
jgi:hypothetical protein